MHLYSFTACSENGYIRAIEFKLSESDTYNDPGASTFTMETFISPIGDALTGNCVEHKLLSATGRIKASHKDSVGVTKIEYYDGASGSTYPDQDNDNKVWSFNEEEPLVGMYGYVRSNGIQELSFFIKNKECQCTIDGDCDDDDDDDNGGGNGGSTCTEGQC